MIRNAAQRPGGAEAVRVLLIDDDRSCLALTRHQFSKIGPGRFALDWASTYEQGLARIRKGGHDVYLLDYHLGDRTGLELLREALAQGCTRPIIMLTAENPAVDAEAMRLGAADFLNKDKLDRALLERSIRYSLKHFQTLEILREREAQMNAFMKNVPCAVYIKDFAGRYLYANEACAGLFGRRAEELVGQTDADLLPKTAAAQARLHDQQVLAGNRALETTESFAERGGLRSWLTTRFPICGADGLAMLGAAAIDITANKRLEWEIQNISEQEKRRIGQDLHDGLGQYLTGIACLVKVVEQKLESGQSVPATEVRPITALVNETIGQARDLARGLCPVEIETGGLQAALAELAGRTERVAKVRCTFAAPAHAPVLDNAAAVHLYRIAQEGVTNALKHAQPARIRIALRTGKSPLVLTVQNDGGGLPLEAERGQGLGLRVMQYRAGLIGAALTLESVPGRGTVLRCAMPPATVP